MLRLPFAVFSVIVILAGVLVLVKTGGAYLFWIGATLLMASWQYNLRRGALVGVCFAIATATAFTWFVNGVEQRAPLVEWRGLFAWQLWGALAFILAGVYCLRYLPAAALSMGLCCVMHVVLYFHLNLTNHLLSEACIALGLAFIGIDPRGFRVARWIGERGLGSIGRDRLARDAGRMAQNASQSP